MPARESTDQKVGGSSPSERAQVKGRLPHSNRLSLCPRTATRTATGGMGGYSMQGWAETGSTRLVLVGLVAVELVAQPPERVPGHLVRYLGVDLHRERDAAVPEYRHGDARVYVEPGQALDPAWLPPIGRRAPAPAPTHHLPKHALGRPHQLRRPKTCGSRRAGQS